MSRTHLLRHEARYRPGHREFVPAASCEPVKTSSSLNQPETFQPTEPSEDEAIARTPSESRRMRIARHHPEQL
jgi:hypothetical protein